MYHNLFIQSLSEEHFSYFDVLVVMNKASLSMCVWVLYGCKYSTHWLNTKKHIAKTCGRSMFSFVRRCQIDSCSGSVTLRFHPQ